MLFCSKMFLLHKNMEMSFHSAPRGAFECQNKIKISNYTLLNSSLTEF